MSEPKRPREWWVSNQSSGKNINGQVDLYTAVMVKPDNPPWTHVIEAAPVLARIKALEKKVAEQQAFLEAIDRGNMGG